MFFQEKKQNRLNWAQNPTMDL